MPDETDERELTVVENPAEHCFEIRADGEVAAYVQYEVETPGTYALTHTKTLPAFAGQGMATTLVRNVLDQMRASAYQVLPYCPFVNSYLRKHPADADLVPAAERRRFGVGA